MLYGDRLVGLLDATADHDAGLLRVHALHRDGEWTAAMATAEDRGVEDLARWLELTVRREQADGQGPGTKSLRRSASSRSPSTVSLAAGSDSRP